MTFRRSISAALLLAAGGCAVLPSSSDGLCLDNSDACPAFRDDGGVTSDAGYATGDSDLETGAIPELRSALCGACNSKQPDDVTACLPVIDADAGSLYDASLPPPAPDAGIDSCRMVLGADQTTSAACVASGTGGDGASCTAGSDCMPGFECVGTGTCRHYCCNDESCTAMSNGGSQYATYFCDVEAEKAASGAKVPVCRQVVQCAPLKQDSCNVGEACTVVEIDNGAKVVATCDATGDAMSGSSCEIAHCVSGSACIGPIGARTCQQLCNADNPCPSTMNCNMKSQALQTFNVGVCSP